LEQKWQAQLAAEAMEGFPEVADTLRGRLPHPETLAEKRHPLAGEVRRIWESLKKPTRRRTKEGRAIDRTNEANAFFLPKGEFVDMDLVRRSVNELGFDFQTPAEMLDALDVSISYGKPFYGTRQGPAAFAVSRADVKSYLDSNGTPADAAEQESERISGALASNQSGRVAESGLPHPNLDIFAPDPAGPGSQIAAALPDMAFPLIAASWMAGRIFPRGTLGGPLNLGTEGRAEAMRLVSEDDLRVFMTSLIRRFTAVKVEVDRRGAVLLGQLTEERAVDGECVVEVGEKRSEERASEVVEVGEKRGKQAKRPRKQTTKGRAA
jgi:hypothetical protein